jgi:hypothetical protein
MARDRNAAHFRVTAMVTATAALMLAGCSSSDTASKPSSLVPAGVSAPLTAATWTDGEWPFTVSEGVLKCYLEDSMVTFTANGVEYGLNNTAIKFGGYADIDDIRPDGPVYYVVVNGERQPVETSKVPIERVLRRSYGLCPPMSVKPN